MHCSNKPQNNAHHQPCSYGSVPYLSIVIPAYNEGRRIGNTLQQLQAWLQTWPRTIELIVVNDGSRDNSAAILNDWQKTLPLRVLHLPQNQGKGTAVREGMLAARGSYRLFMDADLATPLAEVDRILAKAEEQGSDLVIGARQQPRQRSQPWLRKISALLFQTIVRLLVPCGVVDTQCGFKLLRSAAADELFRLTRTDGFMFDLELLILAKQLGYRLGLLPVVWKHVDDSTVSILKHGPHMLLDLLRIRQR
jgi:glycosyltransferase involved in cell wall biosynthesis